MKARRLINVMLLSFLVLTGCGKVTEEEYSLSIHVSGLGSVTGAEAGKYQKGTELTLTAVPEEGYGFDAWEDSSSAGTEDMHSLTYSITLNEDHAVTAYFSELPQEVYYSLEILTVGSGTVTGGETGSYLSGTEFTLTAVPSEGYEFDEWTDENVVGQLTDASYSFTLLGNKTITARFTESPQPIYYTLSISVSGSGTVTGGQSGFYLDGTEFTLTAEPGEGYEFDSWEDDEAADPMLLEDLSYSFILNENHHITAVFTEIPQPVYFTLTIIVDGQGSVEGGETGSYLSGTEFTLTAVPDFDYTYFEKWTSGEETLGTETAYSFVLEEDYEISAHFLNELSGDYYIATFGHVFNANNDFKTAGGSVTINGLDWTYSPFKFLGQNGSVGVQIGSKNNPQKDLWTLSTQFGTEVKVLSYGFKIGGASGTNSNITVTLGDSYSHVENNTSTTVVSFNYDDLEIPTAGFTLSLQAVTSAAIYFHSLTFTVAIPVEVVMDISADEIKPKTIIPGSNGIPAAKFAPITLEDYYSSVNLEATGSELVASLRAKITALTRTNYGDAKTMLIYTDESYDDPGFVLGMWDGDLLDADWSTGTWQREHVWACTNMGLGGDNRPGESTKNQGSDLHNLRAACPGSNGAHASLHFDNLPATAGYFYPNIAEGSLNGFHAYNGDFRGDLARILFYMYITYDFLSLNDAPDGNLSTGKLSALLSWHAADPVDNFEIQRNNRIYGYQGNRNPFIDYPSLVSKIAF